MVPVLIIAVTFLLIAVTTYLVAARGKGAGAGKVLYSQGRSTSALINIGLAVVYIGFGVVAPILILTGNHSDASANVGSVQLTVNERTGRELFGEHCAVCHTLASANAIAKIGPNLDQLKPPASLVLHTIKNGCVQVPPASDPAEACLAYGTMPADVVSGKDARDVANYVAAVAGKKK
ncbi:MAG TPA: cytochrome c [Solirubrobacteraceae bacterium]|nr:cytochrome c [Solirubrobacteraceae bacterium]